MNPTEVLRRAGLPVDALPRRLSGGDMGEVWRVGAYVVKSHPRPPRGLFLAEAQGLERLASAGVAVPSVHHASEAGLVLEWLGEGAQDWPGLGRLVARLHRATRPRYGSPDPLFLGRFALPAGESDDWRAFWASHRIEPLLRATAPTLGPVAGLVREALAHGPPVVEGPVLVHGDLWAGNVHFGTRGAFLIDPSCQAAERAVDLAMMKLFGGFPPTFWAAYEELAPVPQAVWRAVPYHQLLFLLVHVHFFGESYVAGTEAAARSALQA